MKKKFDWFKEYGVTDYGYTEELVPKTYKEFNQWVKNGFYKPLNYLTLEKNIMRSDLRNYWGECQSAICFIFSYYDVKVQLEKIYLENPKWNKLKIAAFTLGFSGDDYHYLLREKLNAIGNRLKLEIEGLDFKIVLDTQAVLERDLAMRAGLGWFGKNSMLINRHHGSFFILGSILINKKIDLKKFEVDSDHCGQCRKCVDACPTAAIDLNSRTINAIDCISTFTIEQFKDNENVSSKMNLSSGYIFGCDICQDVCPWNSRLERMGRLEKVDWNDKQLRFIDLFLKTSINEIVKYLNSLSHSQFRQIFTNTSFYRSGKNGLIKNFKYYLKHVLK